MATQNLLDGSQKFGLKMVDTMDDQTVTSALDDALGVDETDRLSIFRCGYVAGAADSYATLTPRAVKMGKVIKSLYVTIEAMMPRHDDINMMNDLLSLHSTIAQYLIEESELIMLATKGELAERSSVPVEYIDDSVTMSEIPSKVLLEVGRATAAADMKKFAIFAVSGCKTDKEGEALTMESLQAMVDNGEITVDPDVVNVNYEPLILRYGAVQIRRVRVAYRKIVDSLAVYKKAHEGDAAKMASNLMTKMMQKE